MTVARVMGLAGIGLFLATTCAATSQSPFEKEQIVLSVTSDTAAEAVAFESSYATPGQSPPFRYLKAATPFEVTLRDTKVLCAIFSAIEAGAKIKVQAVSTGPGDSGTTWAAGRTVILNLEEKRSSVRGF